MSTKLHLSCATSSNLIENQQIVGSLKIEWLDSSEAAIYLKIPVKSLMNQISAGRIPYHKFGRLNRYRKDELDNILLQNKRGNYVN